MKSILMISLLLYQVSSCFNNSFNLRAQEIKSMEKNVIETAGFQMKSYVFSYGGITNSSNGTHHLCATIGQLAVDSLKNDGHQLFFGFWRFLITSGIELGENIDSFFSQHYQLYQNYPNPFNPETNIRYFLPHTSKVVIEIYNSQGESIIQFLYRQQTPGNYFTQWDGRDASGEIVSSGVYFYRIRAHSIKGQMFIDTRKMLFVK